MSLKSSSRRVTREIDFAFVSQFPLLSLPVLDKRRQIKKEGRNDFLIRQISCQLTENSDKSLSTSDRCKTGKNACGIHRRQRFTPFDSTLLVKLLITQSQFSTNYCLITSCEIRTNNENSTSLWANRNLRLCSILEAQEPRDNRPKIGKFTVCMWTRLSSD